MGEEALGLTVACCLWGHWPYGPGQSGGNAGMALGVDYVNRLYRGVQRNIDTPHRFVLMCDDRLRGLEGGVVQVPLKPLSMEGCLPKLAVHRPDNGLTGRVLVFDLDTVIVGSLDGFCDYRGPLATRAWFGGIARNIWMSGGDLLGFDAGSTNWIWERFAKDPQAVENWTEGRERFVYREWCGDELKYWQKELPGQLVSYKWHVRVGLPPGARAVSCHGRPRPHEIQSHCIKENWR